MSASAALCTCCEQLGLIKGERLTDLDALGLCCVACWGIVEQIEVDDW